MNLCILVFSLYLLLSHFIFLSLRLCLPLSLLFCLCYSQVMVYLSNMQDGLYFNLFLDQFVETFLLNGTCQQMLASTAS